MRYDRSFKLKEASKVTRLSYMASSGSLRITRCDAFGPFDIIYLYLSFEQKGGNQ